MRDFEGGGIYVWPMAGENSGRVAAVVMNLLREERMYNYIRSTK